jgi:hypothetical protein
MPFEQMCSYRRHRVGGLACKMGYDSDGKSEEEVDKVGKLA